MKIDQVVNCGGIAEKNPLVMQIYADVTGRPMKVSRSAQTCALGAAIAGAVVAGAHKDFAAGAEGDDGVEAENLPAEPEGARGLSRAIFALPKPARRLRHEGVERQPARRHEDN